MESFAELLAPNWDAFATVQMWIRLLVQLALFCCSAFFSGSEVALFALSRVDLRNMRRSGDPHADTVHALLDQPRRLIISILCGNEVVNVAASANITAIFAQLYGLETAAWATTFVMVPLILLLGEVTPKTIAVSNPVKVSTRLVAPVLSRWIGLAAPLVAAVRVVADRITTWFVGPEKHPENILEVDEFRTMLEEGVLHGELSAVERAIIHNLLDAGRTEVMQLLTPRTKAAFLDGAQPLPTLLERFAALKKKRVPVYRGDRDHIVGELRVEDVVELRLSGSDPGEVDLAALLRPVLRAPSTLAINELLDRFQKEDAEAAVVVGEFEETLGVVTMTDIIEFLWGHTYGSAHEPTLDRGSTLVPSAMKLGEFNRATNLGLRDPRMTTIGGVVMRHLGRPLEVGDQVVIEGAFIEVVAGEDGAPALEVRPMTTVGAAGAAAHRPRAARAEEA